MIVRDLGELTGEVLLFGGPYSNLQALRAVLDRARDTGAAICTGDVTAYCGAPAECVAEIRAFGCPVVAGNVERQLAAGAADCGCGFGDGTVCDWLSASWYAHLDAAIGAADRVWMAGLPDLLIFRHAGRLVAVLHGGATDVARFVWSVSDAVAFAEEIAAVRALAGPVDMVIAGHSGIAFHRRIGAVDWINAGVIGMPPNDGRPETEYAVLGPDGPRFERLSYDVGAAIRDMRRAGLTQGYDDALRTGRWPSEEILPEPLRRGRAGVPAV